MKCPQCQFTNQEGAKYCNECGSRLIPSALSGTPSLSFDEKLEMLQRYLPQGLTEKILAQKDRIEGERKQVTVMFCDMEGFTPLVESVGPEETYLIMDQVYEILIQQVNDFEGTVNEMTGDGIVALFGAPIALEEASQRALWSALSIHRELARFNEHKKSTKLIEMRIGIHSGPVVVGTLGTNLRVEFKAVGDTVNLASRMEKLAAPGTTYVTEAVFRQTRDYFNFENLGKKSIKGKAETIHVYKLLSARQEAYRPGRGSERMIFSKMIGRSSELELLERQVMKVVDGRGGIVNIIGEAGIGKSRLIDELSKCEAARKVTLLEGKAVSMGRSLSFHPIIDILKQWARIGANEPDAAKLKKLEKAVGSLFPEKAVDVLVAIAILMGIKLPVTYQDRIEGIEGEALEKLILKNMRDLLTRANELSPLVIVMEDLHWADTSSIELLGSFFRLAETQRILFINLMRPGDKETGDRIVETAKETLPEYYVEIHLKPLDDRLSETLITQMLDIGGVHHALIGQIVQRAGGNPYFIEEVVRSLIDEGAIVIRNEKFEVTEKIGTITIPNTINDLLMARIDRLEAQARDLVKVASVIGRSFFYRILTEVANTVQNIDDRLSYLKEIELFLERRRMEEQEYLFKHALAQEAAYDSILPQKRKDLHLRVAGSIEKVFGEKLHEFYGMLAYHCSRGENLDKAEDYLLKAGEEALKSSASNEALHYYREALALYLKKNPQTADPEKVAMLEKNIALALYNRGQYVEAIDYFDKALNYYWGKLPQNAVSASFKLLWAFLHLIISLYLPSLKFKKTQTQRDVEVVDLVYKKCKALAIIDPKQFFLEFLYVYRNVTVFDLTKFELGLEIFLGGSALFSFSGLSFKLSSKILNAARPRIDKNNARLLINYDFLETIHHYFEGNWDEIKEHDDDLVDKNLNIGGVYDASQHLYWHAVPNIYRGSLEIAKSLLNRLNNIAEIYDNDFSLLLKYELNINLLIECRRIDEALLELDEAIRFVQRANFDIYLFDMYSYKAWLHILMGDIESADEYLRRAHEVKSEVNAVPIEMSSYCRSHLEYHLYRLNESIEGGNSSDFNHYSKKAYKSAIALLRVTQKAAQHRTESFRLTGLYYWLINKRKKAFKWWDKAIEEGKLLGARLELSRTYFAVGSHLLEAGSKYSKLKGNKAEEYLKKAGTLFREMDLQWDLAELNKITMNNDK